MSVRVDGLFAPPDVDWQRVSPRLTTVRRVLALVALALLGVALVVALLVLQAATLWYVLVVAGLAASGVAAWWWIDRVVARWGYAEQAEELFITRGRLFRALVVVPYGRMQYVDVEAGPVDQLAKIAKVHLHTASPGTTAVIPGLDVAEAARLRDRLTQLGEARGAGL